MSKIIEEQRKVLYETIEKFDGNLTNADVIKESMKLDALLSDEMTIEEATAFLGLKHVTTIHVAIKRGIFNKDEYRMLGNIYLIKKDAIKRYKDENIGKYGFSCKRMENPKQTIFFKSKKNITENETRNEKARIYREKNRIKIREYNTKYTREKRKRLREESNEKKS